MAGATVQSFSFLKTATSCQGQAMFCPCQLLRQNSAEVVLPNRSLTTICGLPETKCFNHCCALVTTAKGLAGSKECVGRARTAAPASGAVTTSAAASSLTARTVSNAIAIFYPWLCPTMQGKRVVRP